MISPLTASGQTRDEPASHTTAYGAFSCESAGVDRPLHKCGSTSGACQGSMAPADFTLPGHTAAADPGSSSLLQHQDTHVLQPVLTVDGATLAGLPPQQQSSKPPQQLIAGTAADVGIVAVVNTVQEQPQQQEPQQLQQTESEDDSWTPGEQASNGEDHAENDLEQEETWDPDGPPPQYCTNCTARLYSSECSDCGHSSEQDEALFDCSTGRWPKAAAGTGISSVAADSRPLIIWDDDMLLHEEGKAVPHPERPDRLRAIMARLTSSGLTGGCSRVHARLATKQELLRVHTSDHLQRLQLFCSGTVQATIIPADTYINQHTLHCAALAAGSAAEAAVRVVRGEAACGAAIIRPPGHHAESNTAMGFCFFNNAAVAARAAQAAGAERVLILDWDVHHGNGTQHIFESDPSVLYMSLHRYDRGNFYPGTGAADEVGQGRGAGFTVNVPWDAGNIGNGDYMTAMQQVVLPIAREFAPNLIIISAGFDAAEGDPIGGCCLTPECFGNMTAELLPIAPTVMLLEGGYNLLSTALSTESCLRVLLGEKPVQLGARPSAFGWLAIQAAKKAHSRYWSCLAGAFPQLHGGMSLQQQVRLMGSSNGQGQQQQGWEDELEYGDTYEEPEFEDCKEDEEGQEEVHSEEDEEDEQEGCEAWDDEMQQAQAADGFYGLGHRHSWDGQTSVRLSRVGGQGGQGMSRASVAPAAVPVAGDDEGTTRYICQQHRQQQRYQRQLSRKQQMLRAIHRQAMKSFWRRRLKHCQQQQTQQQEAQQ